VPKTSTLPYEHQRWSMDFVYDALTEGQPVRVLTVVDQWSRESPLLEVATVMSGRTVAGASIASSAAARSHARSPSITARNSPPGRLRTGRISAASEPGGSRSETG
jgi:transposase InsO family protein